MKCKIFVFIGLLLFLASCKENSQTVSKTKDTLPVQHTAKPVTPSPAKVSSAEVQDYKARLHNIVERMNKAFAGINTTGNPEDDFSKLMITNHFAGIEMCELQVKAGQDSSLKALAQKKISFLHKQEDYFDAYQFNSASGYRPPVKKVVPQIKHLTIVDTANKDVVFAQILSEYNQNTIDLAWDYLKNATDSKIRKVAQNIIQAFSNEIVQLKRFVK